MKEDHMSKTYSVTFTVIGPEGAGDTITPYPFDDVFESLGMEIVNVAVEEEKE